MSRGRTDEGAKRLVTHRSCLLTVRGAVFHDIALKHDGTVRTHNCFEDDMST